MGALQSLDLFDPGEAELSLEQMVGRAEATLLGLLRENRPLRIGFSSGKDSTTVVVLAMNAARKAVAEGLSPLLIPVTSDTLVENPEVSRHYQTELAKMQAFGRQHGFKVMPKIVTPSLASSWQMKILTGRGIPSFAGTNADCSMDLKVGPQRSYSRKLQRGLAGQGYAEMVTLIGTRFLESERRRQAMLERAESDTTPARNKDGDLVLSPVCFWTEDMVWECLGEAAAGSYGPCYSDFAEMRRIYAHSSATSCAVVADALSKGRTRGGCGTRTGCWSCQQSEDKSLQNLISFDPQYAYLKPLNAINRFIRASRNDWSRRHWVGRTIEAGYIAIRPDTYHPSMIRELTRFMLQADFDEEQRARAAGEDPRFVTLPPEMMVAIDAMQSLNGLAKPFQVWADWRDIRHRDIRYDVPFVPEVAEQPMPVAKYLYVGQSWDDRSTPAIWTGLRDPLWEGMTEGSSCQPVLRSLKDGRRIWDVPRESSFGIDIESLGMFLDFELDHVLEKHDDDCGISLGSAYKFYVQYGLLTLSHGQHADHDAFLRRTHHKHRLGLTLDYDPQALYAQAVPYSQLPDDARRAWRHLATTDGAQMELLAA